MNLENEDLGSTNLSCTHLSHYRSNVCKNLSDNIWMEFVYISYLRIIMSCFFFSVEGNFYSSVEDIVVDRKGPKLNSPLIFSCRLYCKYNKNLGHPVWVWTDLQSLTPQCRLHVMLFMEKNNKENLP
jgi:hypothetical protein